MASNQHTFELEELTEEERFRDLVFAAQLLPLQTDVFEDGREIPWLEMGLAQSGQAFFQKNYTSILIAHSIYFGRLFGIKPMTSVFLKLKGSHGAEVITNRFMATLWYILRWYESDIIGCYTEGFKAISKIRKTHDVIRRRCNQHPSGSDDIDLTNFPTVEPDHVLNALKGDLKLLDMSLFKEMDLSFDPPEHMSQFVMALTQMSFLLPVFVHPEAFGINDTEGMDGFEHLWAVIGHLSGIEDRFNLPLQRPGREFYLKFWKQVMIPSFLVRDSITHHFHARLHKSASYFMPQISPAASHYIYLSQSKSNLNTFTGVELYKLTSWTDRIFIVFVQLFFSLLFWSSVFRSTCNWFSRKLVKRGIANFIKSQGEEAKDLTTLPPDIEWSKKYRKPKVGILHKWKKSEAMTSMMTTSKSKRNKGSFFAKGFGRRHPPSKA